MPSTNSRSSSSWAYPAAGKSTIAGILAGQLDWDLAEGDDLHPAANVAKMAVRNTTDRRRPMALAGPGRRVDHRPHRAGIPGIITCSALRRSYRDRLSGTNVVFVHLAGTKDIIGQRLTARMDHYMPATLLDSQIATLEPPEADENAVAVLAGRAPAEEAAEIIRRLGTQTRGTCRLPVVAPRQRNPRRTRVTGRVPPRPRSASPAWR